MKGGEAMAYGVKLEVWGEYASFNRPEMKVERVSYEFMTPSAARGILEAIYWKPQMRWVVDRIRVLAPIRFTQIRRNELDQKIPGKNVVAARKAGRGPLGIFVDEHRQQRASRILRDVRYGIEAHLEVLPAVEQGGSPLDHPEAKHLESFKRRAAKGQYFHHPYLGCREFPANFRLLGDEEPFPPCPSELRGEQDFGYVLWDVEFVEDPQGQVIESNQGRRLRAQARFFKAVMRDGVVQVPSREQTRG
jgi:CRISPR-associated protein Cas5d